MFDTEILGVESRKAFKNEALAHFIRVHRVICEYKILRAVNSVRLMAGIVFYSE